MDRFLLILFLFVFSNITEQIHAQSCTGAIPSNIEVTHLTSTSASVSWAGSGPDANYNVRIRTLGALWQVVSSIDQTYVFTLLPCTTYEVQVSEVCGGVSSNYSQSTFFTTLRSYCQAAALDSTQVYISNVTVSPTLNNQMTNTTGPSNYSAYNSPQHLIKLVRGSVNNFVSITKSWPSTVSNAAVVIWIDFNGNGIFEAAERMFNSSMNTVSTVNGVFNVPVIAGDGQNCPVVMRVVLSGTSNSTSPCGSTDTGEIEDYGVEFIDPQMSTVEKALNDVEIFPNPVLDKINIANLENEGLFAIYSANGQFIKRGIVKNNTIDVYDLHKGVYRLHMIGHNTKIFSFIKE